MLTWCVLLLLMASQVESFDSRDLLCHYGGNSLRPAVAKSYSFGGYTQATATQLQLTPTGDQDAIRVAPSAPADTTVAPAPESSHHAQKLLSKQVRLPSDFADTLGHLRSVD